ncbi:unnamed protein product, partial [Closterium sp. Naga37s-1]
KWAERCNDNPVKWRIKYVGEHNHPLSLTPSFSPFPFPLSRFPFSPLPHSLSSLLSPDPPLPHRSYFRCAHKTTGSHPCPAKKWAERCNDNPFNWRIKYVGEHNHSKPPPRPVTITIIHDGPVDGTAALPAPPPASAPAGVAAGAVAAGSAGGANGGETTGGENGGMKQQSTPKGRDFLSGFGQGEGLKGVGSGERSEQQEACLGLAVSSNELSTSKQQQQQQQQKQTEGERGSGDCGAVSATERADRGALRADIKGEADGSQAANLRSGPDKPGEGGGNSAEADLKREEGAAAKRTKVEGKVEGMRNGDEGGDGDGNGIAGKNGSGDGNGGEEELESQPSIDIKPRDAQSNPSAWASAIGSSANDASVSAGTSGNSSNPFPGYTGPLPSALMQGALPTPMWLPSLPRDSPRILIGPGGARWPMGRDSPGQLQSPFSMLSPLNTARVFSDVAQAPLPSPIDLPEIKGE